ncbi:plasmid transfer operon, TraF, protein [Marinobacter daqiaonensis]|uniref:Plasmid transfer operon, TraF, protein n=1 Tax=Marinobacter daqiaonensis TaxID=650891 RepID=A0A1I6HS00_9GAMM|nr:conjugal transfer protein TraF [Marinobacter daqiaonensis]SFR57242.1 plasmid transfer operon, TraF, protein [Marinobacter daqiaonensis]
MKLSRLALAIGLSTASTVALAAPQSFNTARSFAMGGTGVAIAHPTTANSANPAMLAADHHEWSDDLGLILPSVNARYADEEEVIDQVDGIQTVIDEFNSLQQQLETNPTVENADALGDAAGDLRDRLLAFDRDTVRIDAAAGLSLAVPGQKLAVGVFTNGNLRATVRGELSDDDIAFLNDVVDAARNQDPNAIDNLLATRTNSNGDIEFTSRGRVLAAGVVEAGVSLARPFNLGLEHPVQLGVAPKYVQLRTFQYTAIVNDFDEENASEGNYETTKSGFNLDLGVAYAFGSERQWNSAIAVKNVIPMELDSAYDLTKGEEERTLELNPKVTVGIAHTGSFHVLTAEADLTKQEAFGYEDDTQWIAVGAELDAWRFAQLRLGARHNIASNDDSNGIEEKTQFTAGLGLSPFGARLDVAGLVSDADVGAAIELGFAF